MNIHEYQSKNLLIRSGIDVLPYSIISSPNEIVQAVQEMGLHEGVLKVQVHAGGRGKAGGVKVGRSPEELVQLAGSMMGMKIVNQQTGPDGIIAHQILLSPLVNIQKEYYLAVTIDRSQALPLLIASSQGGMNIEEIAEKTPESILKVPLKLDGKIREYQLIEIVKFLKWEGHLKNKGIELIIKLVKLFFEVDALLLEINPLVLTQEGNLTVLDTKLSIDDNALFRQPAIAQWYDPSQYSKNEVVAKEQELAYIELKGNIGCLVNGAGLAMATMDILDYYGGAPANFLDIGGGANQEAISHGFTILLLDEGIKSIFVNIFGGIMDCKILAQALIKACNQNSLKVPLIVRIEGTNVEIGKQILKNSGLNIITAETMAEGAIKAVNAAKGNSS